MNSFFTTTVVITTKNRIEELKKALDSCMKLKGNPEIFVFDDGSEDGTFKFVVEKYPTVKIHREEKSIGLIDARTKAATLVSGDIIFSIDDDACFSDKNTIIDILPFFNHPKIAAVSIPYIDVYKSDKIRQPGIGSIQDIYIYPQYRGTAHALRKDVFLNLGGYRKNLVRQEEETDYAIKLYKNDFIIRVGNANPILHYESPKRNYNTIAYYAARNNILIAWIYTPVIFIVPYIINLIILLLIYGMKNNCFNAVTSGLKNSFSMIIKNELEREKLTINKFYKFRILRKKGTQKVEMKI